jgi:hypothetical protein
MYLHILVLRVGVCLFFIQYSFVKILRQSYKTMSFNIKKRCMSKYLLKSCLLYSSILTAPIFAVRPSVCTKVANEYENSNHLFSITFKRIKEKETTHTSLYRQIITQYINTIENKVEQIVTMDNVYLSISDLKCEGAISSTSQITGLRFSHLNLLSNTHCTINLINLTCNEPFSQSIFAQNWREIDNNAPFISTPFKLSMRQMASSNGWLDTVYCLDGSG